MRPQSIFISRDLDENSKIKQTLLNLGHQVVDKSLIKLSQIRFTYTPRCDWIFFNSKNAIRFFFAQNPVIGAGTRFAVMGQGSAKMLEGYGRQASFTGTGNDATAVARQFIAVVDSEIVLFPQAIDSMQTVQRWLPFNNIARNLFVYKVELITGFIAPKSDILVFTSPSNVNAYFSLNKISGHQSVIAIGTTTRLSLKSKGIPEVHLPAAFNEDSLLEKIIEVSHISDKNEAYM
jgi:uroporphyrinogen-III synthase